MMLYNVTRTQLNFEFTSGTNLRGFWIQGFFIIVLKTLVGDIYIRLHIEISST